MPSLVTRFHLLLFCVTIAIGGVALAHLPAGYAFPAHWQGSAVDWFWPRDVALLTPPLVQLALVVTFYLLGRALTRNHFAKVQHILDPALTLLMSVAAACQLGLLMIGIGSDFDLFRITTGALAATLIVLAVVIFEAERHSYAGLRMPWPVPSDRAWSIVHRSTGLATAAAAILLAAVAWIDPGPGVSVITLVATLLGLPAFAASMTLLTRGLR
ncbi:hypothetical protein SAMN06295905_0772 [Devosia lucknowensis]|uniref:SdpI/YhfL protein family protein n=2 Tax=Devosia lucknowensis TaxID=1096929 RepID=A0A1Y6EKK9_9HYPH|nr:hypothetical protein SAMN06295905_0772 [Devosia lucknowensis]